MVFVQNVSSLDMFHMKDLKNTLRSKKYILALCTVNKVFLTRYPYLTGLSDRCILQWVIVFDNVSDWPFFCTLKIMKKLTLNRNVFLLHYTLLNLFQSWCSTLCHQRRTLNTQVMSEPKYSDSPGAETKCTALYFSLIYWYMYIVRKKHSRMCTRMWNFMLQAIIPSCQNIRTKFYFCSVILMY